MTQATALATGTLPIACHACPGRFALGKDEHGSPKCFHSLPYCRAFEAVETLLDAIAFANACRAKIARRLPDDEGRG